MVDLRILRLLSIEIIMNNGSNKLIRFMLRIYCFIARTKDYDKKKKYIEFINCSPLLQFELLAINSELIVF